MHNTLLYYLFKEVHLGRDSVSEYDSWSDLGIILLSDINIDSRQYNTFIGHRQYDSITLFSDINVDSRQYTTRIRHKHRQ